MDHHPHAPHHEHTPSPNASCHCCRFRASGPTNRAVAYRGQTAATASAKVTLKTR
jgi:hypothetical protein